jgi:hypothetical protein
MFMEELWNHFFAFVLKIYYFITKHGYKKWLTWLQKMIFNTTCENLSWQVPKSFMENGLIHINVTKNVQRTFKKCPKKSHLFNSKTIIIKAMSLVVSLYHLRHPCCVMVCVHLVIVFYDEMNYVCHDQSFVVPNNLNHN